MAMTADNAVYLKHTREIRDVAANIRNIVNANQGWIIAGWYQKGEIVDASASGNDASGSEITSNNHPIHISYLYPTQPSCLDDVHRYPTGNGAVREAAN
jgi:hypothetical protein